MGTSHKTFDECLEELNYDPETGDISWTATNSGRKTGVSAGCICPRSGYRRVRIQYRFYAAHRVIWRKVKGAWPSGQLDHINGDKLDNRIDNLRECTVLQNSHNRAYSQGNALGIRGVRKVPSGRFQAHIMVGGKSSYLGTFDTAEQASAAYESERLRLHPFWATGRGGEK